MTPPRPVLIAKTGSTLPSVSARRGDFHDWIAEGLELPRERLRVVAVHEDEALPSPAALAGVVVTGSSALVTDRAPWSERAAEWLGRAVRAQIPVLGICYGHQLLARALGGEVADNPRGREIGTIRVRLAEVADDPLLGGLPRQIAVQASHVQSVTRLPDGALWLGESDLDPHQLFRWGRSAWGLQFHPEFDADIVRGYIAARADELASEGLDPEALAARTADAPHGRAVLRRFGQIAGDSAPAASGGSVRA